MELFFGSLKGLNHDIEPHNIVTFAIPDIGVRYKAPFPADKMALEYASLLTLLEFIEINPKLFGNRALELYSNNANLVKQVNECKIEEEALAPLLRKALEYKARLNFSLNWIRREDKFDEPTIDL